MTTTRDAVQAQDRADRFGRAVAARLQAGADELPYEISERLRAARVRAVAQRHVPQVRHAAPVLANGGGTAVLGQRGERLGWWGRIASVVPLMVLAAG